MLPMVASEIREKERLFIGLSVPNNVAEVLTDSLTNYKHLIKKTVPRENWHITILFMGEVDLEDDDYKSLDLAMPQTFMLTVTLTRIGKGLNGKQLWAYAKPTKGLNILRKQVQDRAAGTKGVARSSLTDTLFTPHITLANFRLGPTINLVADTLLSVMWRVDKLYVYRSRLLEAGTRYLVEREISLIT